MSKILGNKNYFFTKSLGLHYLTNQGKQKIKNITFYFPYSKTSECWSIYNETEVSLQERGMKSRSITLNFLLKEKLITEEEYNYNMGLLAVDYL